MEEGTEVIEQFHSRVSIDPMVTVMYRDSRDFIEHAIRNLFNGMGKALQEKFSETAQVHIQGCTYPPLWAHPTNVAKYAEVAGRKVYGVNPPPVELTLDLWVMTEADYRDLLRRAERGDERRDAQVAATAKAVGRSEEKARIKGKLTKLVEGVVAE